MPNGTDFYRSRARQRLIWIAVALVAAGGLWWWLGFVPLREISSLELRVEKSALAPFSAPPPLVATGTLAGLPGGGAGGINAGGASGASANGAAAGISASPYALTREGIISDTNAARAANGGLPAYQENTTLDEIATLRLEDMFAKQYFAHVSPSSSSAETVAASVGYSYLALGENLALGYFVGDQGVVTAWMNSPGHRANILNTHYTQIGVAAGAGNFQGERVWIAVQIFGRPASDCPLPDPALKATIDSEQSQIASMQTEIAASRAQLNAMQSSDPAYSQAVAQYNALVTAYNSILTQAKANIAQYNALVTAYNQCLGS